MDFNLLLKGLVKKDFPTFMRKCFSTVNPGIRYQHNWHLDLIAEYLDAIDKGQIKRLIINIPPRYLKSFTCNVTYPAWVLANNPTKRVISVSYSQALSLKHSIDSRALVESKWFKQCFKDCALLADQNEKHKFMTEQRGFRFATSVGGTLTGEGGDLIIIDDPQNPINIHNHAYREHSMEWFSTVLSSRLDDKKNGAMLLVMQRLHEEDLTGKLLKRGGWEHLSISALNENEITYYSFKQIKAKESNKESVIAITDFIDNNLFNSIRSEYLRKPNSPLHFTREGFDELDQIKADLGDHAFAAQYLQNPAPAKDGMVRRDWLCYISEPSEAPEQIIYSWDTAIKTASHNDYTVCTRWKTYKNFYFLDNLYRGKLEYPELLNLIDEFSADADVVLLEDKASGQSLIQDLRKNSNHPVIAITPHKDKLTRFAATTPLFEASKVKINQDRDWRIDLERELLTFPNSKHDDQVDSISQFLNYMKNRKIEISKPNLRRF